jgi:hypothetical protein
MAEAPRSNRPTPRTAAAVEAELRRRIRAELTQARSDADGRLDDAALAEIIARAVASGLTWHLEAPEHTRNATVSSRTWRPAGGPRGGRPQEFSPEDREPRDRFDQGPRDFNSGPRGPRPFNTGPRGPRQFDRGPRDFDSGPRGPRDYDQGPRDYGETGPREFDRGPRRGPPPRGGGFKRGGFGPKRPPRSR